VVTNPGGGPVSAAQNDYTSGGMSFSVRAIADDELVEWVAAMHVAFHVSRPAEDEARHRREVRGQDLSRTLAAVDEQRRIVGTYFSFTTELTLPGAGACVAADAVTAVSVLPTHHRRGLLRQMLTADMQAARERGEVASVLIAAEYPIYGRFGFGPATEQVEYRLQTQSATFLHQAPGTVELVSPESMRQIAPSIFDQVRRAWPGQIDREDIRWEMRLGLKRPPWREPNDVPRCATYTAPGSQTPSGYVLYRGRGDWHNHVPGGRIEVDELMALDGEAYLGLWRYCAEIDLVSEVSAGLRRAHEPLPWLLADPRKAFCELSHADFLWLRALDTPRLLEARRYVAEERLVLEVDDPLGLAGGRFALEGGPDGALCRPTTQAADVRVPMMALGALVLGGTELDPLAAAGLVDEYTPHGVERAARVFSWPTSPWCSTFF
jgi:predicted acetyltransferase